MYRETMNADEQITAEESIAAIIFEMAEQEMTQENCQELGREILLKILTKFRPDLISK